MVDRPATAFLLCGLPGAGKTTLARRIALQRTAIRFTEDEWLGRLYDVDHPHDTDKRTRIKAVQWRMAEDLLARGGDIVLDWGLWLRAEREHYRRRVRECGAEAVLIFLDVPLAELWRRIDTRNQALSTGMFPIDRALLDHWHRHFEAPTVDESPALGWSIQ